MKWVFFSENLAEAYLIRDLLRQRGIAAEVANEIISQGRGEAPLDLSTMPSVWIADESRAAEAEALVAEFREPSDAPDWTCDGCGETVPGSFTACWKCGAERA